MARKVNLITVVLAIIAKVRIIDLNLMGQKKKQKRQKDRKETKRKGPASHKAI